MLLNFPFVGNTVRERGGWHEGFCGMLYGDCGREGDPTGPAAAGAQPPVAGGGAEAAGRRFSRGDLLGGQRRGGTGAAYDFVNPVWRGI